MVVALVVGAGVMVGGGDVGGRNWVLMVGTEVLLLVLGCCCSRLGCCWSRLGC